MRYFVILFASAVIITHPIAAKKAAAPVSPLDKISRSFSDDKLGRITMPNGAKLMDSEFNNPDCSPQKLADCYVRDVNGLELYFSPYDGLNRKQISFNSAYTGVVGALNIGKARAKADVLAAIGRFIPGLKFECAHYDQGNGVKNKELNCSAPIPEKAGKPAQSIQEGAASVELLFGEDGRIKSAAVQHSSLID
jgi:hypothetical protein